MTRVLRGVELLLFVAAMVAFGWVAGSYVGAARDQANWASELERQLQKPAVTSQGRTRSRPAAIPVTGSLIGRIDVPRLGVSVITREGVDARTLRSAVGHVPSSALPGQPGNSAFAGHRDTFFRKLRDIRDGDRVVVTTPEARHEYVVQETRVVHPRDVSVLDRTKDPMLTLVTCYPFNYIGPAPQRFIVRAALANEGAVAAGLARAAR